MIEDFNEFGVVARITLTNGKTIRIKAQSMDELLILLNCTQYKKIFIEGEQNGY